MYLESEVSVISDGLHVNLNCVFHRGFLAIITAHEVVNVATHRTLVESTLEDFNPLGSLGLAETTVKLACRHAACSLPDIKTLLLTSRYVP